MSRNRRHVISLRDLNDEDIERIVDRGLAHAMAGGTFPQTLSGKVVGAYFAKTSTRTRTAFVSGAMRLGAHTITYGPGDLQLNTGETFEDTGRILGCMLDGLVARTADDPAQLRALAGSGELAVINAMSADEHPTQALADLTTMRQRFGTLSGLRVLYLGEGNNSAGALALALSRYAGTEVHFRTPSGYGLPADSLRSATALAAAYGASCTEQHDLDGLPEKVDVVYTTRWQTTGTSKQDPHWRNVFQPFKVTKELLSRFPNAVFMHDLPAHRGEEVDAEVLDGPDSIAFQQAENKMYSAMATLEWTLGAI
ncbi:ornithine carbamoyltransferase [Streptomyces sp. NPDC058369]|uniref:ornithine carbamoyltransferase n=1 Tax=unclassified Streptomyces TaxID=2593676 RepID=UPI00224D7868|nr:ornithine carbamoyltransferase [Streptomyces sp. NBC_01789]MCX4448236.1 ornithine carbamoyltransferase [Streptomyces sp. NBC_01789]